MENENNYCVYKHIFPNGKLYIGVTRQKPNDRWKNGFGYLNKNKNGDYTQPLMARAVIKYGWDNVIHEILFENLTKKEAAKKEKDLIAEYKSDNVNFGYNIEHGGNSLDKFSDITKSKISESKKGAKNAMYGKQSPRRVSVMCVDTGVIYSSLTEAQEKTGVNRISISRCCQGHQKRAGKLRWTYVEEASLVA